MEQHYPAVSGFSSRPQRDRDSIRGKVEADLKGIRLSPTLLLLSDDEALAEVVRSITKPPWKLVRQATDGHISRHVFAQRNVRLVLLDDQAVPEGDRGWLLAQIRKHFSGNSLLYIAGSQSDANEKRARTSGAHYYISKPLPFERFRDVLLSFLQVQQTKV
jgi:response regulator of citrate/malate metabolism